jgi:hypothetical protein
MKVAMMKLSVGATLVVLCLAFLLGASGARLPYSAAIIAGEESALRQSSPEKIPVDVETNYTHHAIPVDPTLPFSCQQQGCGPDVACSGSSSTITLAESADSPNCYLYQGMFLCCTISPLGSR